MRLFLLAATFMLASCASTPTPAPGPYAIGSGAKGGGFHPYAEAAAKVLAERTPLRLVNRETAGSNENLALLESGGLPVALVNMGPAYEAVTATGPFAKGPKMQNLRALVPMYETPFHVAIRKGAGIRRLRDLAGKRVAVGPAKGPGEVFFRGLIEALGIQATLVNGSPADHAGQLKAGAVDAFWYGAGLPVPAFKSLADGGDADVIGFDDESLSAFLKRFPYMARYSIPAGTYRGQAGALASAAVWNFVLAHPSLSDEAAYAITKTLLEQTDALAAAYPAARGTQARNAPANRFLPFHPGALRYYRESGVVLGVPARMP